MAEKIGFVGVGRMGSNMARRLKECGHEIVAVYDLNTTAARALAQELGCPVAEQLKEVTKLSDVIITVVTDDKAMKKIYNGGLLSRARRAGPGRGPTRPSRRRTATRPRSPSARARREARRRRSRPRSR